MVPEKGIEKPFVPKNLCIQLWKPMERALVQQLFVLELPLEPQVTAYSSRSASTDVVEAASGGGGHVRRERRRVLVLAVHQVLRSKLLLLARRRRRRRARARAVGAVVLQHASAPLDEGLRGRQTDQFFRTRRVVAQLDVEAVQDHVQPVAQLRQVLGVQRALVQQLFVLELPLEP